MSQTLFLKTKPSKLFWKAAIPGGISMLVSSLYTVFDALFVGKFLGTTAFAALGLVMPIVVMYFALAELVGVGSSIPISIYLGQREDEKANNYFTCSILLTIFMGILSGILIYFCAPTFMRMMGAEGDLLTLGVKYARIYALFSPITPLMFSLDNYLRISGKMGISMAFNIISSSLIIGIELLLIKVIPLGIVGAAIGSCLGGLQFWFCRCFL